MAEEYLDKEIRWFKEHLKELLREHSGQWAVVYHQKLVGIYDEFAQAYEAGVEETGSEQILVRQIKEDDDTPKNISVNISVGLMDAGPTAT